MNYCILDKSPDCEMSSVFNLDLRKGAAGCVAICGHLEASGCGERLAAQDSRFSFREAKTFEDV